MQQLKGKMQLGKKDMKPNYTQSEDMQRKCSDLKDYKIKFSTREASVMPLGSFWNNMTLCLYIHDENTRLEIIINLIKLNENHFNHL